MFENHTRYTVDIDKTEMGYYILELYKGRNKEELLLSVSDGVTPYVGHVQHGREVVSGYIRAIKYYDKYSIVRINHSYTDSIDGMEPRFRYLDT